MTTRDTSAGLVIQNHLLNHVNNTDGQIILKYDQLATLVMNDLVTLNILFGYTLMFVFHWNLCLQPHT